MVEKVARDRCPERPLPTPLPGTIPSDPGRIFGDAMAPNPSARPFIRQRSTGPFWYGKWSRAMDGPVVRALGRAWAESDGNGGWRLKRGRPPGGNTDRGAGSGAHAWLGPRARRRPDVAGSGTAEERRRRGVTFRELTGEYLRWLEEIKGAKPSTLRDHRLILAEPGTAYRRGSGVSRGRVMAALGDRPAREVTTREIEDLLRSVASTGVASRTVNKVRQLVCAIFNYGIRPSIYGLPANPGDPRRPPHRARAGGPRVLLARAGRGTRPSLAAGAHRDPSRPALGDGEIEASRTRGRPGCRARSRRRLRRTSPRRARRAPLARRRLRRRKAGHPPGTVRRHQVRLDQEPPCPGGPAARPGRRGPRSTQPPRRVHRSGRLRVSPPRGLPSVASRLGRRLDPPRFGAASSGHGRRGSRAVSLPRPAAYLWFALVAGGIDLAA